MMMQIWPITITTKGPDHLGKDCGVRVLKTHFHSRCVQRKDVDKLLNPIGNVYAEIIHEFYANAFMEGDRINCWLKGREFHVTRESIQEILEVCPTTPHTSLQYDERMEKLEQIMDNQINKKALHTIPFTSEMRTLDYIMIFNLYPMRNLTNLSAPRSIFLLDLFTHKEIDICSHIYHL